MYPDCQLTEWFRHSRAFSFSTSTSSTVIAILLCGSAILSASEHPGAGAHWLPMRVVCHATGSHIAPTSTTFKALSLTTILKCEKAGEASPVLCQTVGGRAGRRDGRVMIVGVGCCDQDNHCLRPRSHIVISKRGTSMFSFSIVISLTSPKTRAAPPIPGIRDAHPNLDPVLLRCSR